MLLGNPHVDHLFVIDRGRNKLLSRLGALRAIRSFRPDTVIDLHGGSTSALLSALSSASRRVGYAQNRFSGLYTDLVADSSQVWGKDAVHTVEHQLTPLKHLGFRVDPIEPLHVPVNSDDLAYVRDRLLKRGVRGDFILLHPGAAFGTKQWEPTNYAHLAKDLVSRDYPVVITAGPDEKEVLEAVRRDCAPEVVFLDPLTIGRFSALASLCRLYVGNDTGTTHIAAALGRKIVAIFGSSDYSVWYPWGVAHRLLHSDLSCIPCPGYYCLRYDKPRCIRSIEVPRVLQAALELLEADERDAVLPNLGKKLR